MTLAAATGILASRGDDSTPGPGPATITRTGGTISAAVGGVGTLTIGAGVTLSGSGNINN